MGRPSRAALGRSAVAAGLVPVALLLASPGSAHADPRPTGGDPAQEQLSTNGSATDERSEAVHSKHTSGHERVFSIGDDLGVTRASTHHHEHTVSGERMTHPDGSATVTTQERSRTAGASAGRISLGPVGRVTSNSADYRSQRRHTATGESSDDRGGSRAVHTNRQRTANRATSHAAQLGPVDGRLSTARATSTRAMHGGSPHDGPQNPDDSTPHRTASRNVAGNFQGKLDVARIVGVDARAVHFNQRHAESGDRAENRPHREGRLELGVTALGRPLLEVKPESP
ncbi:hypothetical protein LY12_003154 [Prauserella alba]|nr:hypothetical protein [Prauserella alba]